MNILRKLFPAKRLAIFLLVAVFALTLVACDEPTGTPYGSLSDATYLQIGEDYKVTEKQLYDQLRTSSLNRLTTYIDELVFADVPLDTANLSEFEVTAFEQEINTALFSSATITATQVSNLTEQQVAQQILSFADSFVITNPGVDKTQLINFLDVVIGDVVARATASDFDEDADFVFGYFAKDDYPGFAGTINALIKQYTLPVLKKVNAKNILGDIVDGEVTGELADEDSAVYISEANLVTYYKNNVAGRYDVNALIIQFASVKEHEIARYKYAIKSNSRGEWHRIPNIAEQHIIDLLKADDYPATSSLGKAAKILTDPISSGGLGKVLADLEPIDYRSSQFATYYARYSIGSTDGTDLDDSASNNEVLYTFLQIYDDLNGTNFTPANIEDLASGNPVRDAIESNSAFAFEYTDILFSRNTQLRTYVYGLNKESLYYETTEGTNTRPYSRQVQTFNNTPFLVYLMNDNREDDDDVLDETNSDDIVFMDNAHAQEKRLEALETLVTQRLSTGYIETKTSEKFKDVTINIYDPIIREYYANQLSYSGSYGYRGNNVLASVNGVDILVDDYFELLNETLGLSTALDLIFVQKLRATYASQITPDDYAEFRTQFETQYVNPFLANQYASAGFPASMGIDSFLLLGFGAWAHDGRSATADAIDKVYVQGKLRELFEEDLTVHFPGNTEVSNIYTKYAELASLVRQNAVGISASHLLVYVDLDNDGSPDNPNKIDFDDANLLDLDGNPILTIEDLDAVIAEFIAVINERASEKATINEGLNSVVTAYNNATRYELSTVSLDDLGPNPTIEEVQEFLKNYNREDIWVPFKRMGLKLRFETLGEITNQTNFPGGSSRLDADFFEYAMGLAQYLSLSIEAIEFAGEEVNINELLPFYAPTLLNSDVEFIDEEDNYVETKNVPEAEFSPERTRSGFGWHLILVTGYTERASALIESENENQASQYTSNVANPYNTDEKLSALNDTDYLTWEQILIYIEESKEETGVVTLPTTVQTAITRYFNPIRTAYNNSYSQLEIAFNFIFEGNVVLADSVANGKLQALREANFNQFFNYAYFTNAGSIYERATNKEYAAVYSTWFDVFQAEN